MAAVAARPGTPSMASSSTIEMSLTFTCSSAPFSFTPSSSMIMQNGQATAMRSAPVPSASSVRSMLTFLPVRSSMNMRAPPAPQHRPRVPLRGISTTSTPAMEPITLRGAR